MAPADQTSTAGGTDPERQPLLRRSGASENDNLHPDSITPARKRFIVAAILLSGFLASLDLTIVATCIPTISSELRASNQEAWIGTAYLWSNVTFTPLYGRLSDLIGRRTAYLQALFLFTFGTFLCGCAPTLPVLAVARFIAGMGGGGIGTVSSVIMSDIFPVKDRGFYQGFTWAAFGLGMGLGGPLGGFLTEWFGWRAAFYAQIPFATIAMGLVALFVPRGHAEQTFHWKNLREVDFGGAAALLVSIGALLQALARSGEVHSILKDPQSIVLAVISLVFFLVFVYVELRVAVRPVMPLTLLRRRTPLCCGIIACTIAIVNFNMVYHLPEFFEIVLNKDPSVAGAHLLPNSVAMAVSSPIIGLIIRRTLRYKWITTACCTGPVFAMFLLTRLNKGSGDWLQWLCVIPMGLGFSGLLTANLTAMLNAVDKKEIGTATGFTFMWRSLGQVFGVGFSSAVFQSALSSELGHRFDSPELIDRLRHASKAILDLPEIAQRESAREAYGTALRYTFYFGLIGALLVLLTSVVIPDLPLDESGRGGAGGKKDPEEVVGQQT